jgi:hypothetical protein
MPQPTAGDIHVNIPLTNISIAYIQQATSFVADRVFPIVPVQFQANRYYVYDRSEWFRDQAQERAAGTESAGGGWKVDNTPTYAARMYAIHKDIDDPTRADADAMISLDRDATEWVTQQLLIRRERVFVDSFFKAGVWSTDWAGVSGTPSTNQVKQWSASGSTPIADITKAIDLITSMTGYRPNTLTIGPYVLAALKSNAEIVDRVKYTSRDVVTSEILAKLLEVDRVLVPYGVVNAAVEGATASNGFLFGKGALLTYSAPSPSLLQPSAGYIFAWTGYLGAAAAGNRIKRFRMEQLSADRVEGEMAIDAKVVAPDCGLYIGTVVA